MSFNWNKTFDNLLFYGFDVVSTAGLIATCVGFFSLAVLSEAIKRSRVHILETTIKNECQKNQESDNEDSSSARHEGPIRPNQLKLKLLDVALFSIQMVASYVLMLVVMSFSGWLFVSVVLGQSLGHLVFSISVSSTRIISLKANHQNIDNITPSSHQDDLFGHDNEPLVENASSDPDQSSIGSNIVTVEVHQY